MNELFSVIFSFIQINIGHRCNQWNSNHMILLDARQYQEMQILIHIMYINILYSINIIYMKKIRISKNWNINLLQYNLYLLNIIYLCTLCVSIFAFLDIV